MNLSPTVAEWAAAYEQENGHKPKELALQIAEHILKVGEMLTELGRKDAQEGKAPYPTNMFTDLVRKAIRQITKDAIVKEIADLWQLDYMEGYEGGDSA